MERIQLQLVFVTLLTVLFLIRTAPPVYRLLYHVLTLKMFRPFLTRAAFVQNLLEQRHGTRVTFKTAIRFLALNVKETKKLRNAVVRCRSSCVLLRNACRGFLLVQVTKLLRCLDQRLRVPFRVLKEEPLRLPLDFQHCVERVLRLLLATKIPSAGFRLHVPLFLFHLLVLFIVP